MVENNPRVYVDGPYNVTRIPKGDPDCRLGIKKSSNQQQADGSTKEKKEGLFGYGSGVAVSTDPVYGEVVHAESTLPFNAADVSYYRTLFDHSVLALGAYPTHVAADAAYDFWYVYQTIAATGPGIAAIAPNDHGQQRVRREADGTPYCSKGLLMAASYRFRHSRGYAAQRFRCPLLFPDKTGQSCDHEQFTKGKGCVKDVNMEKGGLMRSLIDRDSPLYHAVYSQRTGAERINSRAKELGIERPKVRNIRSVRNLNTLIYLVLNVRTLAKARSINKGLLEMN